MTIASRPPQPPTNGFTVSSGEIKLEDNIQIKIGTEDSASIMYDAAEDSMLEIYSNPSMSLYSESGAMTISAMGGPVMVSAPNNDVLIDSSSTSSIVITSGDSQLSINNDSSTLTSKSLIITGNEYLGLTGGVDAPVNINTYGGGGFSVYSEVLNHLEAGVYGINGAIELVTINDSGAESCRINLDASTGIISIGSVTAGNYSKFDLDGTYSAVGDATYWLDELIDASRVKVQGSGVAVEPIDGYLIFLNNADYTDDYVYANVQLNHNWKVGSNIRPHIHWVQEYNTRPNFLLEYRWQRQGQSETTSWTACPPISTYTNTDGSAEAFRYASGSLNQITEMTEIVPPAGHNEVSDIIQFRLYRDTGEQSIYYANGGTPINDTYTGSVQVSAFDIHKECDTLGSRSEYTK